QKYEVKFSPSGMRDLLHRLNFTYKKPKVVPAKANIIAQLTFLMFYEYLKSSLGKHDKIYFCDATHPQYNSKPTYGWIFKGEEKHMKTNSGRQRINILGAVDVQNLDSIFLEQASINMLSISELI